MNLSDFEHLRCENKVRFIEEYINGNKFTTIAYMISDASFWELPMSLECRGNVFDETGRCVSRTFPKFFNLNENKYTQFSDLDFTDAIFFDKKDGSMITTLVVDDEVYLKTKKSFYSDVAKLAQKSLSDDLKLFIKYLSSFNLSPIFEFTSPDNKVVIDYGIEPKFTLLAIIDNETGIYVEHGRILNIVSEWKSRGIHISVIEIYDITIDDALNSVDEVEGIEGYVCLLKDGTRVKIKTEWYRRNHRLQTDLTYRDIAEMVADETLDDMKAEIAAEGISLDIIDSIEKEVTSSIMKIVDEVEKLTDYVVGWSDKDVALQFFKHPLFSLLMMNRRGKEPKYSAFWKKRYLKTFSTRSIYNKNF
ncbi:RNA ligase [Flavobacterium sp.]|uniref:RNA ligase n=1 Tax=Flavobacterium sp. TaxID=239 RepID=UPI002601A589|nr:RNA ligase [Flavobacterium sp.]